MPNHGYCKNCWWYKENTIGGLKLENGKLIEYIGDGYCWMHDGDGVPFKMVKEISYCPDYINRVRYNKRNKKTLDDLIHEWYEKG